MARKKPLRIDSFKTTSEMDKFLEEEDLGNLFEKNGVIEKPRIKKVNLDLPEWLVLELDVEATRAGVSRQPLIKLWLLQKLEEERKKRSA